MNPAIEREFVAGTLRKNRRVERSAIGLGKVLTFGSNLPMPCCSLQDMRQAHADSNSSALLSSMAPFCSESQRNCDLCDLRKKRRTTLRSRRYHRPERQT